MADKFKIQGYVPLYNRWVIKRLIGEYVGTTESDVVSNMVLHWFNENKGLLRTLKLTETDYAKESKRESGPRRVVPFPEPSRETDEPEDSQRERSGAR